MALTFEQIVALPMYEWSVMRVGASSPPFTHRVTAESIADYCRAVRNQNPHYARTGTAPATFAFKCAPLRRNEVMHAEGYASPEEKGDRQTPYVTSELRCQRPIRVGDEVTSVVTLAETYERRGSQFVVWECRAVDARGEHVLAYRYTTIWRQAPRDPSAPPAPRPAPARAPVASPADLLPTILKVESQEAIDAYAELTRLQPRQHNNTLHSNPEFARRTIFGGTVNMGVATAAYCAEVVEQAFGPDALLQPGARLEYKGIKPIRAGYEITIDGQVVARQPDGLVTCELTVMNREGLLCGVASATARPNGR